MEHPTSVARSHRDVARERRLLLMSLDGFSRRTRVRRPV